MAQETGQTSNTVLSLKSPRHLGIQDGHFAYQAPLLHGLSESLNALKQIIFLQLLFYCAIPSFKVKPHPKPHFHLPSSKTCLGWKHSRAGPVASPHCPAWSPDCNSADPAPAPAPQREAAPHDLAGPGRMRTGRRQRRRLSRRWSY